MSSKTKTGLSETPLKGSPATPRVNKLSRGANKPETEAPASAQNSSKPSRGVNKSEPDLRAPAQSRLSIDRSSRNITPKSTADRRLSKVITPPEKPATKAVKGSELQAQLSAVQEDLKKAKEHIALVEEEKAQVIDDLKQVQKVADEAKEKLQEALVAQKRADEDSEIEKFRALELEQVESDTAQKKEEEWQKELESARNQHALDVAALISTTQELQWVKQELARTTDAKNQALNHADDATKIAEIHAGKVEILSSELIQLKALLDSRLEMEASKTHRMVAELTEEIDALKQELEKAKSLEDKLVENEDSIEQLNVELEAAKMAESYAGSLAEEWRSRADKLEMQLEEANKLERSASESLCSVMKELEGNNNLLRKAEREIATLKDKVGLLETTISRQKSDLEESKHHLGMAKGEAFEMAKRVESLKSELEAVKEGRAEALNNEKLSASSVQSLLEEKNKLIIELENAREEEERSKKAAESLASALHEVSAEALEANEKLLSYQVEHECYKSQIDDLRLVLKEANQKYESVVDDAKHEINLLKNSVEESKNEFLNSKSEWEQKEQNLMNRVKKSEEENSFLEREIDRLENLLKQTEEDAYIAREEEAGLKDNLDEVEAEVVSLQENLGEVRIESLKLKESILGKDNELQNLIKENEELRNREINSRKKVEELSKLLEEAMAKKQTEDSGELTGSEKDYDVLPRVIEFSEENGHVREEKPKTDVVPRQHEDLLKSNDQKNGLENDNVPTEATKILGANSKPKHARVEKENSKEVEFKMWESCKIEKKECSSERETEQESLEDEVYSKAEGGESVDQINGLSSTENLDDDGKSPSEQQLQKKKKPLLRKFGSLLKKKSSGNMK